MTGRDPLEDAPPADVPGLFDALPSGTFHAMAGQRRWVLSKSLHAGGRSGKLVGHAAQGGHRISFNLYCTARGWRLRPCEMPAQKVIALLRAFRPQ